MPTCKVLEQRLKQGDDLMSFITQFQVVWTVVVMILFLAIVFWAWSGCRKKNFDDAANIPLEEENLRDEKTTPAENKKETSNA